MSTDLRPARTTPNLGLPVPGDAGPADYVTDTGRIADRLDSFGALVTQLPGNARDGDTVYFVAAEGALWHLRYNADSASAHKWESIGGGPISHYVTTAETATVTGAWHDLATVGPTLTLPLAGDYKFDYGVLVQAESITVPFSWSIGLNVGGGFFDTGWFGGPPAATQMATIARSARANGLAAGAQAKLQYNIVGFNAFYSSRYLHATPIRLGGVARAPLEAPLGPSPQPPALRASDQETSS